MQASQATSSALGPLSLPVFRLLWFTWFVANTTMWMNDVAAAWLMTSLAPSPLWVALVQTASTLPVFLLGLPSGALADIVDRRRYLLVTQLWLAGTASVLCVVVLLGWMNPALLLVLTFANGIGLAMRWPVFSAVMPEVLPRDQLAQGLALNSVALNASRILGPLAAGALIASAGSVWVFVLNAVLSLVAAFVIFRWRREHKESPLGRERLGSAMRVGVQFVSQSYRMRALVLRIGVFFLHATALLALLPLIARSLPDGGAATFTLLLAAMGTGAILGVLLMPRIRSLTSMQTLVTLGTLLYATGATAAAFAPNLWVAVPAMFACGMAWITVANAVTVAAQMALPDWVRARGMSIYQMTIMGASAAGAALWGQMATLGDIHRAVIIASVSLVGVMLLVQRFTPDRDTEDDLTPSHVLQVPNIAAPENDGRVQTRVEYLIDPARASEFLVLMEASRSSRLRQGALSWELLHDLSQPQLYVEQIVDESWTEHLRRFDRISASDVHLRDQRLSFHIGEAPPRVTRFLIEQV